MSRAIIFKLFNLLVGAVTARLAGVIFRRVWKATVGDDDPQSGGLEVVLAWVAQAAIFGLVQSLLRRGGASGIERVIGEA